MDGRFSSRKCRRNDAQTNRRPEGRPGCHGVWDFHRRRPDTDGNGIRRFTRHVRSWRAFWHAKLADSTRGIIYMLMIRAIKLQSPPPDDSRMRRATNRSSLAALDLKNKKVQPPLMKTHSHNKNSCKHQRRCSGLHGPRNMSSLVSARMRSQY